MNVLVIDDHPIVRMGVRRLIESRWPDAAVTEVATIADAVASHRQRPAELMILDVALPDAQGTEGLLRMQRVAPGVPVLILSLNKDPTQAQRLLQLGASGYVTKDRTGDELTTAIERVLSGGRYIELDLADRLLTLIDGKADVQPHEQLSTQEFRVMQMIAAGERPSRIAEVMHLSVKTVGNYRARILAKTGWRNNTELTKYCVQHGLTEPE